MGAIQVIEARQPRASAETTAPIDAAIPPVTTVAVIVSPWPTAT
jgi:hypothetical protein